MVDHTICLFGYLSFSTFSLLLSGPFRGHTLDAIHVIVIVFVYNCHCLCVKTFILTRPKPASGRQGLVGSWGQDTDEVSTFLVFLTSHFTPAALSSDLNQPGTIDYNKNPLGIMKTDLVP